jgi:phosphoserine phosphatase
MGIALLFDLDDTLMVEEQAAAAAFAATAQVAAARHEVDAAKLAVSARSRAREQWYAGASHDYCMRVGISSWEGLWCRFEGDAPDVRALREWSPTYRRESWGLALTDQGVDDPALAAELAERFGEERRARHEVFADAADVLAGLAESHPLAVLTNGAGCLQREKLAASGLGDFFHSVVVSADLGTAKPDAAVFRHALDQLGVEGGDAVMVGDSIAKDIDGALATGLGAVWVNRNGHSAPADRADVVEISTLSDLPEVLGE